MKQQKSLLKFLKERQNEYRIREKRDDIIKYSKKNLLQNLKREI